MKKGFTLAEVLITLGIIGVVAALTMPVLVGNYKKKQTVTQLKKVYSALQQSIQMSQVKYGDIVDWDWTLDGNDFFMKYLANNFNVVKNCGINQGCWNNTGILDLTGAEYPDNPLKTSGWSSLILSDGTYVALVKQDNNHIHFVIDLNGSKKPDTLGKDIFEMTMTSQAFNDGVHNISAPGIYMYGHGLTAEAIKSNLYGCSKNNIGLMCGEKILMDGWDIAKDYPW